MVGTSLARAPTSRMNPRLGSAYAPDCYGPHRGTSCSMRSPRSRGRRFTIYLPRGSPAGWNHSEAVPCRSPGAVRQGGRIPGRGVVHYHAIVRLDAATSDCQPPPVRYTATPLSADAIPAGRRCHQLRHGRSHRRRPGPGAYPAVRDPTRYLGHPLRWSAVCTGGGELTSPNTPPRPLGRLGLPHGPSKFPPR